MLKVGILGSCVSRDIFMAKLNENYKKYFDLVFSYERMSFISLMQNPVKFDYKDLVIEPENAANKYKTKICKNDLTKDFFNEMKKNKPDYLVIDVFSDVKFGIYECENIIITGNDCDYPLTNFFKKLSKKDLYHMEDYPNEYFTFWKEYCNSFFKYLSNEFPNTKVILNKIRVNDTFILNSNVVDEESTGKSDIYNPLIDLLENYIESNFNVTVLDVTDLIVADNNSVSDNNTVHYKVKDYDKLCDNLEKIFGSALSEITFDDNKIKMLEEYKKQLSDILENYMNNIFTFEKTLKNITKFKNAWDTVRIDIKNRGNENNSIKLFKKDIQYIPDFHVTTPKWFKTNQGQGTKIEHKNNKVELSFQCVRQGNLNITLRGLDYRNKNDERIPVYINFSKVIINNKVYLDEDKLIWHNNPYNIRFKCRNKQLINLRVESKTIYDYCPDLKLFFDNVKTDEELTREYKNIMDFINTEKSNLSRNNNQNKLMSLNDESLKQVVEKNNLIIFGSCVSIDPFRSCYNDYKKDFIRPSEHERSSIISLMSPKIDYLEKEIAYSKNINQKRITSDIKKDFDKYLLQHLKNHDYLLINLVHDIRWGVLSFNDKYITNTEYIDSTEFYNKYKGKLHPINVFNNEEKYYELWKASCDSLFKYINENIPNLKVFLQKIELVDYYMTFDGKYVFDEEFHKQAKKLNPLFKKYEEYIEMNYDVEVIPFPTNTTGDEGHIWGLYTTHYTKNYYKHVYNEVKIKILEDQLRKSK